jgi:hypothetical protein
MEENCTRRVFLNYGPRGRESEERPVRGWTKIDFNGDEEAICFFLFYLSSPILVI